MAWKKLGNIFENKGISKFLLTHASNPLCIKASKNNEFKVYFSGRDINNCSSVGSFKLVLEGENFRSYNPIQELIYGEEFSYYSHGIGIGTYYEIKNEKYISFMGWQNHRGHHWRGDIGRIKIDSNESLTINPKDKPLLGIDEKVDLISLSYPWIIFDDGLYKMWYGSTIDWESNNGEMIHVINYATSKNGVNWVRHGLAIPYQEGYAQAFSRPCVIRDDDKYRMWFSYRSGDGTPYRIGLAEAEDGRNWKLKIDEVGINVSSDGWDKNMICYPHVFDYNKNRYMLYNGNKYGLTGIGLAIWV